MRMRLFRRWALKVTSSPRRSILWPASIAFILSYSSIYVLFSDLLPNAPIPDDPTDLPAPDAYVRQTLVLPPAFSNALNNDVPQAIGPFLPLDSNDTSEPWVQTIGQNLSQVDFGDKTLLQTVLYTPKLIGNADVHTTRHDQLSASGLLISYVYYSPDDYKQWVDAHVAILNQPHDDHKLNQTLKTLSATLLPRNTNFHAPSKKNCYGYNFIPTWPFPIVTIIAAYALASAYIWIALSGSAGILSQAGLAIAFVVQVSLSMFSALTITSLMVPSFSQYHLRQFMALPYLICLMAAEHMLRLVDLIAKTPSDNYPLAIISAAVEISTPKAIKRTLLSCLILCIGCIPWLGFSYHSTALCLFTILALLIDLILHLTFFIAVLSVDMRRLELQDVVKTSPFDQHQNNNLLPHQDGGQSKNLSFHIRVFVYFRRINLKQYFPPITIYASCGFMLFYLLFFTQHLKEVDHPTGKFAYFLSPLVRANNIAHLNDKNVMVFEPIVVYAKCLHSSKVEFALGKPLNGSLTPGILDLLSLHLFLEFAASLAFILSLTGIVLKFLVPNAIEIPPAQEFSDNAQFFSKDLVDYQALDILKIIVNESWIATFTLDHKVFVWNAAQANTKTNSSKPLLIPIPDAFWPVSKVVMNGAAGLIALFSPKTPALLVWNFKKNCQEYFIHNDTHFGHLPVDAFFSGVDLIVITRQCTLLSIPSYGENIGVFPIKLEQSNDRLISATRLLTPKINEQVVCVSLQNNIIVGTHVNFYEWKFEKIDLLESMAAIPKPERDPLFSSQFTDEFSVQLSQKLPPSIVGSCGKMEKLSIPSTRPIQLKESIVSVIPVPEIHMVMLTTSMTASLLDIQTGTILQHFRLGHFKRGSLRVFHSEPTHCRFCGCASVESISVAYRDAEDETTVIVHTLIVENRAKNNICLRVERDPREKRCLGFEAATEHHHWIGNVEGWDTTEMNMIMGVRRKEDVDNLTPVDSRTSFDEFEFPTFKSNASTSGLEKSSANGLVQRKNNNNNNSNGAKDTNGRANISVKPLNVTWEGWAMSATGRVSYYDIPDFEGGRVRKQQLLIKTIGPVTKYGRKSIAVAFGNLLKILYFGNEESFFTDVEESHRLTDTMFRQPQVLASPTPPPILTTNHSCTTNQGAKKWRRGHI